jgi:hypothetical protein
MLTGAFTRRILLLILGLNPSFNCEMPGDSIVGPSVLDEWISGDGIKIQGLEEFLTLFVI